LWIPGRVTWYYDNSAVGTATTPAIFDQQDFFIILGSEEGNHWIPGNLIDVTARSINLSVEWVHVFQPTLPSLIPGVTRLTPVLSQVPTVVKSGQATLQRPLPAGQNLSLSLVLPNQNQAALDTLLQQLYDPQSTNYHQFLTPSQFTESFGPTQPDYEAVIAWAQTNGLSITATSADRLAVTVSGSVAAINRAFQITMNSYVDPSRNGTFVAPDREPSLDLAVQLLTIQGLTSLKQPAPRTFLPLRATAASLAR
jgi:hypothetical protein